MVDVKIPFLDRFKPVMLNGQKTWTTRSKRYGVAGDTFKKFGAKFKIVDVVFLKLQEVSFNFNKEGLTSRDEFIEVWNQLHPRKGYEPDEVKYVHIFKRVK